MLDRLRQALPWLAAIVVAAFAGSGLAIVIVDDNPTTPDRTVFTVTPKKPRTFTAIPTPNGPVVGDTDNEQQRDEQRAGSVPPADGSPPVIHQDLRDETPPGVPLGKALDGLKDQDADGLRKPQPLAGAQGYSCPTRHVINYSSRGGQKVLLFVLHITVSPPGSINGIFRQFNTRASGTSSTFGMELTGRCQQWVPFSGKPWTQGNFNGRAESVEIITYLRGRPAWLASPLIKRGTLANLVADRLKARGLPPRLVDPKGCGVQKAGVTDHDRLECGNNHVDVGTGFPWDVFMPQVRRAYYGTRAVSSSYELLSRNERKVVSRRCYHRTRHLRAKTASGKARELRYARRWKSTIGHQRAGLRKLGLTAKRNRAKRHRILGGYATGKAC